MKCKFLAVIVFAITALAASAKVDVQVLFSYENATFAGLNLNYRLAEKLNWMWKLDKTTSAGISLTITEL